MSDAPTLATAPTPSAAPAAVPSSPSPQITPPATPITPGSKAWVEISPEQRHAQLRGPENPRSRGHSPARDQREAAAAAQAPGHDAPAADPAADPQAPGDGTKFKVGKYRG